MTPPRSLGEVLSAIEPEADCADKVTVADLLQEIGERSFAPLVLVVSVLLVTPLSGIPGTPTIGALIVVLISAQWLTGRRHLWLPGFVLRRAVTGARLARAIAWLRPMAAWVDARSQSRLRPMTAPPMALVTKLLILLIALTWPLLELLPMVTSVGAMAVSLLAFGLMVRDGLWLVAGYATLAAMALLVSWFAGQVPA
ncbi:MULTISPECIES: exopolysaccharide biosynthesis protein [Marinovum]|uniref:exopolysaccharide biosynthesis protein n=1 Tax=Marinovum TaxID=367771 RepID=UPI00237B4E0F|nr:MULTISPECIES: exopolysaccharide biosynthesis protein [Marinovum]MDD9741427.1 exopolysaccharide biosynthesis protein [Marinovum sp. SP66]MDD9745349.1 exopolysaccharide biosynthesis protein [Marinovum sp. PR37]